MARDTIASLRRERDAAKQELADFRQRVWDEAMQAAEDHDMCGVVEETLAKVGLFPPTRTARVVIDIPDLSVVYDRHSYEVMRNDDENVNDLTELVRDKLTGFDPSIRVNVEVAHA